MTSRRRKDPTPSRPSPSTVLLGLLVAVSAITASCSTTTSNSDDADPPAPAEGDADDPDDAGSGAADDDGSDDPDAPLAGYRTEMTELCDATRTRLGALPDESGQVAAATFAAEAALVFEAEAERADTGIRPPEDVRPGHRSYVETTRELAAAWEALAEAIRTDADDVSTETADVAEFALGRADLANELGLESCADPAG